MFDVCLLGTGGMAPLPKRALTSCLVRFGGSSLLIDCGEGTQVTLREQGWSFKDIDYIFFTHYHGDHISGLPGLLLSIGNCDRTEPLTLVGPKGLQYFAEGLLRIARELPFELKYVELAPSDLGQKRMFGPFRVTPFEAKHGVVCYGYRVEIERLPLFDAARAQKNGVPLNCWNKLQHGVSVTAEDGTIYTPDMVLGEPRKGLSIAYCTDSRPVPAIAEGARGVDLFICEGMYGDEDAEERARNHMHMSFQEAARLAAEAGVGELWLTHYSPALPNPKPHLSAAQAIFANTKAGKDRLTKEFVFEDEK